MDYKEIKPVHPKGNQPWIFIGRTDAEAPIPWPLDAQSQLTEKKTLMLGKIEIRRRRWQTVRWIDGISDSMDEFEPTSGTVNDREAWRVAVHGVTKSWTWLSEWRMTNSSTDRPGAGHWKMRDKNMLFSWGKACKYDCFFSTKILLSISAWKVQRNAQNGLPLRDTEETERGGSEEAPRHVVEGAGIQRCFRRWTACFLCVCVAAI